jgi:hypothetical protein
MVVYPDYYSITMIPLKKQKFLNEYGIGLNVLHSDKGYGNKQ